MSKVLILLLHGIKDISSRKITDLKVKAKVIRLLKVQTGDFRQFATLVIRHPDSSSCFGPMWIPGT